MACQIPGLFANMPYVEDNTHCKLKMFWQQILQLGDAFVDSVTSFLLDESVGQLVCLLQKGSNVVSEIQALLIKAGIFMHFDFYLPCSHPHASFPSWVCTRRWETRFFGDKIQIVSL